MNIENDIFQKAKVDFKKLIDYGFKQENNEYILTKRFKSLFFLAEIKVSKNGTVNGRVFDLEDNEEYNNFRIESQNGSFVNKVREEYKNILLDIKKNCFINDHFLLKETNKLTNYIKEKWAIDAEFLWEKYPDFAIFRNKKNHKWFALIARIEKSKLDGVSKEDAEIINLKIDEKKLEEYLKIDGIYEAYHMNHKKWISIILDGTVEEKMILFLLEESYNIVNQNKQRRE